MMKKILCILIGSMLVCGSSAYASSWKELHEKADALTVAEAEDRIAQEPDTKEALYVLGLCFLNAHQNQQALETFQKITAQDKDMLGARWGVAEVLRRQHKVQEAESILQELVKKYPQFPPAFVSLAYIKYLVLDFRSSVALAQSVLAMDQGLVDTSNLVRAYLLVGGGKGMLAHYGGVVAKVANGLRVMPYLRKAERLQPQAPGVLFGLGSYFLLAPPIAGGDIDKALAYLEKAVEIDPLFVDVYVRLAQAHKEKNDLASYELFLEKALSLDPKNELALDVKSGVCKFVCP
ncbi:MAG: tetratricopeptide repeat protein [Candidatus Omnitrophica bacterium]|nr:tetratricopeptide repeat protein [Candidatus Omnitrophota bacterium]